LLGEQKIPGHCKDRRERKISYGKVYGKVKRMEISIWAFELAAIALSGN
jgi:hypothetical protein